MPSCCKNNLSTALLLMVFLSRFSHIYSSVTSRIAECGGKFRQYGIHIRPAKREDIPNINRCNMDNLPENYSNNFYINHLTRW